MKSKRWSTQIIRAIQRVAGALRIERQAEGAEVGSEALVGSVSEKAPWSSTVTGRKNQRRQQNGVLQKKPARPKGLWIDEPGR